MAGAVAAVVVLAAVAAAVVLTAAVVVLMAAAETRVSLLWGWAEMMDLCCHTHFSGNLWLKIQQSFGVCVFVGIPKRDE